VSRSYGQKEKHIDGRAGRFGLSSQSATSSRNSSVRVINILGKDIVRYPVQLEREIKIKKYFYPFGITAVDCNVDEGVNGCAVLKIDENSACSRDNRLRSGDLLLSVNNEQMRNVSNSAARSILARASLTSRDVVVVYIPQQDALKFKHRLIEHCDNDLSKLKSEIVCIDNEGEVGVGAFSSLTSSSSVSICSSLFSSSSANMEDDRAVHSPSVAGLKSKSTSCSSSDLASACHGGHQRRHGQHGRCRQCAAPCSTCSTMSSSPALSTSSLASSSPKTSAVVKSGKHRSASSHRHHRHHHHESTAAAFSSSRPKNRKKFNPSLF
jgi:hypothetical protein